MKYLTPDQEIIKMHEGGYDIRQIAKKVGLGIGYVTRQIREHYRLNGKVTVAGIWGFIFTS